jgi:hypothetical protein
VVEASRLYAELTSGWQHVDVDMSAARHLVVNTWTTCRLTRDDLLTRPERWGDTDYKIVTNANVRATLTCPVIRAGTGHGLAVGFDRTVADGITLSNAPDAPDAIRPKIYGIAFFPWPRPIDLATGDVVTVEMSADFVGEDYVWRWKTRVSKQGDPHVVIAEFDQSTFHGAPLSPAQLRKQAASHVPTLNEDGRILRFVLDAMRGEVSVGEIAQRLTEEFPDRFAGTLEALRYVGRCAREFS